MASVPLTPPVFPQQSDDGSSSVDCKKISDESNNVNISQLDPGVGGDGRGGGNVGVFEKMFDSHFRQRERKINKMTWQGRIYNFLERPTGWRCFIYHFSV